jgi:hypothetical protein
MLSITADGEKDGNFASYSIAKEYLLWEHKKLEDNN